MIMMRIINWTVHKLKVMKLKPLFPGKNNNRMFQFDFVSLNYHHR